MRRRHLKRRNGAKTPGDRGCDMDLQSNLPGVFLFILLVSAFLTAPLSMFLLWLYRRAVLRGMGRAAGVADAPLPPPVPGAAEPSASDHGDQPGILAGRAGGQEQARSGDDVVTTSGRAGVRRSWPGFCGDLRRGVVSSSRRWLSANSIPCADSRFCLADCTDARPVDGFGMERSAGSRRALPGCFSGNGSPRLVDWHEFWTSWTWSGYG